MDCALTGLGNSDLISVFWQQWTQSKDQLYQCCLKLMNSNPTEAEDALSQAMLKAWEKVQKYAGKIDNLKAWLFKLTRNLCIDIIRARSRGAVGVENIEWVGDTEEMGIGSTVASPESCLERQEKSTEIQQAIANLPETLRDTFILHFYYELTHTEIAQRQGISYDNVCRRIHRARKQLKEKLSSYFRGTLEKVSITARNRKSSTLQENGENQQRIESEDQIRATVSPSPHLPIPPSQPEVVEAEQAESVDSSVARDNVGLTVQEMATVSVEIEGDHLVEAEKQECVDSSVESRELVGQMILGTATELTEIGCVEVVELEKDGCVKSSVELYQIGIITISKSLRLTLRGRKQSQELRRLLPIVAMTNVQLDSISKDNRYFDKISNFIKPFLGTGSQSYQKSFFYYPLSEKKSSLLYIACSQVNC